MRAFCDSSILRDLFVEIVNFVHFPVYVIKVSFVIAKNRIKMIRSLILVENLMIILPK